MKIETNERALSLRGTVKDQDLPKLREVLIEALTSDSVGHLDLEPLRSVDVYLLQLVAVALSESATRGRSWTLGLPRVGRELASKVGLEPHLSPFLREKVSA